jgi:hypothetical protein
MTLSQTQCGTNGVYFWTRGVVGRFTDFNGISLADISGYGSQQPWLDRQVHLNNTVATIFRDQVNLVISGREKSPIALLLRSPQSTW